MGTQDKSVSAWVRIPMIQASALVAESVTFPIDVIKTRMQVEQGKAGFAGTLRATLAVQNGRQSGLAALYKGIQPAIVRHWIYTATRITLYEDLRCQLALGVGGDTNNAPLWCKMAAGLSAGAIGQFVASPADLVKVRLQTGDARYTGFVQAVRTIAAKEGMRGFYTGWKPNVVRAGLVNLGELATYDHAKRVVMASTGLDDGLATHTLSALCSGFFAALCSTPADVCKSNVMSGKYPTMTSCLIGTVQTKGVAALWTGFVPNWLRLGPWQFCFWISYESLRINVTGKGF